MKGSKSTAGIGLVGVCLVVLALVVAGAAGWVVLGRKKQEKQSDNTTTQTMEKVQLQTNSNPNLQSYVNDELGLGFWYPKTWGDATVKDYAYAQDDAGNRVVYSKSVVFGKTGKIEIVAHSTKNIPTPKDVFGPAAIFDWCEKDGVYGVVYHIQLPDKSCSVQEDVASEQAKFSIIEKSLVGGKPQALLFTSYKASPVSDSVPYTVMLVRTRSAGEYQRVIFVVEGVGQAQKADLINVYKTLSH